MKALRDIRQKGRGKVFRGLVSLLTITLFILTSGGFVLSDNSPSIAQYTAYPPFGGTIVKPNVLINLDTSTSLNYFAYDFDYNAMTAPTTMGGGPPRPADPLPSEGYNPNKTYYGYFDSAKGYSYSGGEFKADGGPWNGNFLNWLTMRRSDLLKKALIGGKTKLRAGMVTDTDTHAQDLVAEPPYVYTKYVGYQKKVSNAENYTPYTGTVTFTFDNDEGLKMGGMGSNNTSYNDIPAFSIGSSYTNTATNNFKVIVHRDLEDRAPLGVIQRIGNSVRWGLEFMDDDVVAKAERQANQGMGMGMYKGYDEVGGYWRMGGQGMGAATSIINVKGGKIKVPVGYDNVDTIVDTISKMIAWTPATPLAESLWTATGYFRQESATGNSAGRYYSTSYPLETEVTDDIPVDPYNYGWTVSDPKPVYCGDSFVITITDGEPTQDTDFLPSPAPPRGYGNTYADGTNRLPGWADQSTKTAEGSILNYFWSSILNGSHFVDNVALWGHVDAGNSYRDLRTQPELPTEQYLTHYFIYANFGDGKPDARRLLNWSSGSGTPPNDYLNGGGGAARNGGFIESASDFVPNQASEYNTDNDDYDDTFYEAKTGDELETALLKALYDILAKTASGSAPAFAGSRGAGGNGMLYQASFYPEREFGNSTVRQWLGYLRASEVDADGNVSDPPLWEAGEKLWEKPAGDRLIYTTIDGTDYNFVTSNATALKDYLRATDNTEAADIINYIRGVDIPGYRPRTVTINGTENTWKLGDIIYSSPTPVGTPEENYDRRYKDISYTSFYRTYKGRRNVVYAGANDGMLHAFNAGFYCYDTSAAKYTYATARDTNGNCITGGTALGDELWGFIPQQLLPHLKWLTDNNYTHVYYVDLKPKVTDVRIFTPDADHPNGWGTILIGGMRLGGKDMEWTAGSNKYRTFSAYFALDITDPEKPPKLLWTFTDQDADSDGIPDMGLGLTTSYPAVARVKASDTDDLWVMIVGSGPTEFDAGSNVSSDQTGKVFVVDLKTGSLLKSFDTATNAFMTDPITVDVNLDYKVDVAYIGEAYDKGTGYNQFGGNMYRLVTKNSTSVNDWVLSTLISTSDNKAVTSAPSAALDGKGNMWIFFGTGKFIGSDDQLTSDPQAFYGVKDVCKPWQNYTCTTTVSEADLYDASAVDVCEGGTVTDCSGNAQTWSSIISASAAADGWTINFPSVPGHESLNGERSFAKPVVLGGLLIFTSYIPEEDICSNSQGSGYLWAVYYETGTAYKNYIFTDDTSSTVSRTRFLEEGFASVSAMVTRGGSLKAFAKTSIDKEFQIETETPFSLTSGIAGWKTGECRQ